MLFFNFYCDSYFFKIVSVLENIVLGVRSIAKLDLTCGVSELSNPEGPTKASLNGGFSLLHDDGKNNGMISSPTPILRVHQVGKKVVKALPDAALLGVLVIIANELLMREYTTKSSTMPTYLRQFANTTILELDSKLEKLSSMDWDVDPFLKEEFGALQNQPLELMDILANEILPKIDNELSPFLSTLVADPTQVQNVVNELKKVVRMGSLLVLQESNNQTSNSDIYSIVNSIGLGNSESVRNVVLNTANGILDTVDVVGDSAEGVVKDWNKWVGGIPMKYGSQAIFKPLLDSLKKTILRTNKSDNTNNNDNDATTASTSASISSGSSSSNIIGIGVMLPRIGDTSEESVEKYTEVDRLRGREGHASNRHIDSNDENDRDNFTRRSRSSSFYWPPLGAWDSVKGGSKRSSRKGSDSSSPSTTTSSSTDEDADVKQ